MTTKRENISFIEYSSKILELFRKYNLDINNLNDIIKRYDTSMRYSSPEMRQEISDNNKMLLFRRVCDVSNKFPNDCTTELHNFFKRYC